MTLRQLLVAYEVDIDRLLDRKVGYVELTSFAGEPTISAIIGTSVDVSISIPLVDGRATVAAR